MVQMLFGNLPFEADFKLRSNSSTFYKKVRVSSGPGTGHAYAKNALTGKTVQIKEGKKIWMLVP